MPDAAQDPKSTADTDSRYARQILLPELGPEGQDRLGHSSALVVGLGGLGSPASIYLAAAGVGRLGLADPDVVDASNLQRQILYATADTGRRKTEAARDHLLALNPNLRIELFPEAIGAARASEILGMYDVIIDCTDNIASRYVLNEACANAGKPLVYGSICGFEGQVSAFDARVGPCYRCLYPEPLPPPVAPDSAGMGTVGVVPGLVGIIQASQALQLLARFGTPLVGRLICIDLRNTEFREMHIRRAPDCPVCKHLVR